MDMPKDVGLQAQRINALQKVIAAYVAATDERRITVAQRWAVGDQNIGIIWNKRPDIPQRLRSL